MSSNEYKFLVEPDEELKCMICLEVARDPLQHEECGKLCKECLDRHGRHNPCPNCRMRQSHYYGDKRGKRAIDALKVECNNAKRKCDWQGTFGTLEKHVDVCQFILLPCPKGCKDANGKTNCFMRKDTDSHLEKDCPNREYQCEHCGVEDTYNNITKVHDKKCEKKIIYCPNFFCWKKMQRCLIRKHVADECERTKVPCKYEILGCDVQKERKDISAHEEDKSLHFDMAVDAVLELKNESTTLKQGEYLAFPLPSYQRALENNEPFSPPSFYTHPRGYHMKITVYANGHQSGEDSHISVYAKLMKGRYDSELKWPFVGDVTVTLLNQRQDNHHYSLMIKFKETSMARVGSSRGFPKYISHQYLNLTALMKQYLLDDTLYFRVSVALPSHKPSWLESGIFQANDQESQPSF